MLAKLATTIKNALGTSEESTATLTSVDAVVVINSDGTSTSYSITSGTNEWYVGGTGADRSYTVSTSDTVVITYTVTENGEKTQYTATITSSSTYADGTYYPVTTGDSNNNAYKLYNYLYGTSYSSNSALYAAGVDEIDISGMSIFLVAALVCDGASTSYNSLTSHLGLDFILDVATLLQNTANFNMDVEKVFKGSDTISKDQFEFNLYDVTDGITVNGSTWKFTLGSATSESTSGATGSDGTTTETVKFDQITYSSVLSSSSSDSSATKTYYYIIKETDGNDSSVTYDDTIYGVAVTVKTTKTSTGSGSSYIYTTEVESITYYKLEETETSGTYSATTITADSGNGVSTSGSETVFTFTNTYQEETTSITLKKVDSEKGTALNGAVFTLSAGSTTNEYTVDGSVTIDNITYGTEYTLTETTAPDGYNLLTEPIKFTVNSDGTVTFTSGNENNVASATTENGSIVITVKNEAGYVLPSTGGSGTWLYTLTGLTLCGAALVLWKRREQD